MTLSREGCSESQGYFPTVLRVCVSLSWAKASLPQQPNPICISTLETRQRRLASGQNIWQQPSYMCRTGNRLKDALTLGAIKRLNGRAEGLGTDMGSYSHNAGVGMGNTVKEHLWISAHPTSHLPTWWLGTDPWIGSNVAHNLTMPKAPLRPWPAAFAWSAPRLNSFPSHGLSAVLVAPSKLHIADQCLSGRGGGRAAT